MKIIQHFQLHQQFGNRIVIIRILGSKKYFYKDAHGQIGWITIKRRVKQATSGFTVAQQVALECVESLLAEPVSKAGAPSIKPQDL